MQNISHFYCFLYVIFLYFHEIAALDFPPKNNYSSEVTQNDLLDLPEIQKNSLM